MCFNGSSEYILPLHSKYEAPKNFLFFGRDV